MGEVHFSTDVAKASAATTPWLQRDPVSNNTALTLLARQADRQEQARFWWSTRGDYLSALCFQVGAGNPAHIRTDTPTVIAELAEAVAAQAPDIPSVGGHVASVAPFAATWATVNAMPVTVAMFQRYYSLDTLIPPPTVSGHVRLAAFDDIETVLPWAIAFQRESHGGDDPDCTVDVEGLRAAIIWKLERGEIWLWDDDGPQAMAGAALPIGGVSRIHLVYTPPHGRDRGLAAACTAAAVQHVLTAGATHCVLFTDLANPTTNALYQRLGFEPRAEYLQINFG